MSDLTAIERCFGGAIPAVISTVSADGIPNVTFISRAHQVDSERIALSNQFMSKTARNLTDNPRASLLLMDPVSHDEYRLDLVYERTDRRGPVFERLRADLDALAALEGMQDVFRLRAADIFRVLSIEQLPPNEEGRLVPEAAARRTSNDLTALAELAGRIGRAGDLDSLVDTTLAGLDQLLGFEHTMLLLLDEDGRRLFTIATRGFDGEHLGAEVALGEGQIGIAAERCEPFRVGGLLQVGKYSRSVREQYATTDRGSGRSLAMPGLHDADSRIVVPFKVLGELIGVLVAESDRPAAFGSAEEHLLTVVGAMLAHAVDGRREPDADDETSLVAEPAPASTPTVDPLADHHRSASLGEQTAAGAAVAVRWFAVDASTFFDGDYVIKGLAGRILWTLLQQHVANGRVEFTNRELRLDPTLDLPGFKDNLESRLLLLKRRLDERGGPVTIEKTGRGRFRIHVARPLRLEEQ